MIKRLNIYNNNNILNCIDKIDFYYFFFSYLLSCIIIYIRKSNDSLFLYGLKVHLLNNFFREYIYILYFFLSHFCKHNRPPGTVVKKEMYRE